LTKIVSETKIGYMTTEEIEKETKNPNEEARKKAEAVLKKLKTQQDENKPWVTKPLLGERKVLWFDLNDYEEEPRPNKFAPATEDNPNPIRQVFTFNTKSKSGIEKPLDLEEGQAMEVFNILSRKENGAGWIEVSREATKRGGTKLTFMAV
jgi:hypothetical protein